MRHALTRPTGRLNHTPGRHNRTPSDADRRRCDFLARARRYRPCAVQVAAEDDVSHDNGATAQSDVCGAGYGAAPGDFVAGVLWVEISSGESGKV